MKEIHTIYSFIHGNKIPVLRNAREQIDLVAEVLSTVSVKNQLPHETLLNKDIGLTFTKP